MASEGSFIGLVNQLTSFVARAMASGKLVLTVQLLFRSGGSVLKLTLAVEDEPDGRQTAVAPPIEVPIAQVGLFPEWHIPVPLEQALVSRLKELAHAVPSGPLWLRLVRPYGPLGLLPWEARLRSVLRRPVLRMPDTPFRPAERSDVLENVVLVDPPCDADLVDVRERLLLLVDGILAGSARSETRVHVFAPESWQAALVGYRAHDTRILIHAPPAKPPDFARDYVAPWTSWVLRVMEQRGIDALHFLGRAMWSGYDGCFLLSATPRDISEPKESSQHADGNELWRRPDTELSANDVALLLNRSGAWSAVFAPAAPAHTLSMAFVADELAHLWQGAVLYLDLGKEKPNAIYKATRLLYTEAATAAPPLKQGFLYCHPTFLQGKRDAAVAALPSALAEQALVLTKRAPVLERALHSARKYLPGTQTPLSHVPPGWLAATQRFMETEVLDAARRHSSNVLDPRIPSAMPEQFNAVELDKVTEHLLEEVRAVIARHQKGDK